MSRYLTVAMPKGRLFSPLHHLFQKVGMAQDLKDDSRRLILEDEVHQIRYILSKPTDVPTYVEHGAADLGIAGKDVLLEADKDVAELLDTGMGACRMIVAVGAASGIEKIEDLDFNTRVATKFPRIAMDFFNRQGIQSEIIKLNGSIELAPLVGLAEAIVDITETGRTLQENGLRIIGDVCPISARLIANRVSLKVQYSRISRLVDGLELLLGGGSACS